MPAGDTEHPAGKWVGLALVLLVIVGGTVAYSEVCRGSTQEPTLNNDARGSRDSAPFNDFEELA